MGNTGVICCNDERVHESLTQSLSMPVPRGKLAKSLTDLPIEQRLNVLEINSRIVQRWWRVQSATKLLKELKTTAQFPHPYWSTSELRETLSTATLATKQKSLPKFTYSHGGQYKGDWLGGFRHGYGVMKWPDDSSYEGMWDYGLPKGMGTFRLHTGETYQGKWTAPYAGLVGQCSDSFIDRFVKGYTYGFSNF